MGEKQYHDAVTTLNGIFETLNIDTNGVFVDVGCYRGWWSYAAGFKNFSEIVMIEPNLSAVNVVRNMERFNDPKFKVHHCALGEKQSTADFYLYKNKARRSGLKFRDFKNIKENEHIVQRVQVKTLDQFNLKNVTFVKIDAECNEINVLIGAKNTLINNDCTVVIEISEDHDKILALLKEYGYKPVAFVAKSWTYKLNGDLKFYKNESDHWCFTCGDFKIYNHKTHFRRELKRNFSFNFDKENPIWGDFVFQKEQVLK